MDKIRSFEYANIQVMFDSMPYTCHLWDRNHNMLDCNDANLKLFKLDNKEELIKKFFKFSPERQPDGSLSREKAVKYLDRTFNEGNCVFDWLHMDSDDIPIHCRITAIRVNIGDNDYVVTCLTDQNENNAMIESIKRHCQLLHTVNSIAAILLQSNVDGFEESMYLCMGKIAEAVTADHVYIWKNYTRNGELYCNRIYGWSSATAPRQEEEYTHNISYREKIPEWEIILSCGQCINSMVKNMSKASRVLLSAQGILSIFVAPIFLHDEFWGFIGFDDCQNEREFSENEESILQAAGLLIANSMLKSEITVNIKLSAEQLKESLMEARAANVSKSNFLSNMSHEIRTPMNAILGMAELLTHERLNERQTEYVNDIIVSAKSLLGIINDILDFSKIESGKLELNPVDYDFRALINNIESMFTYVSDNKGLEFKVEVADDIPDCFYGDDIRVRQVLINICGNAVKFTEKGNIKLTVKKIGNKLVFEIKDTGMGIRKKDLPKLFNLFEQADKSRNRNIVGTGLGLPISKAFVEMMGGEIIVESEYGRGSTFTVIMPIVKGDPSGIRKDDNSNIGQALSAPDARILVADDNRFNLKVACGLLNLMDIEAETADSGFKAIELVRQNDYDIVFMDHMMPEMDGIETVRKIRKLGGKYEDLTIIALTANAIKNARKMFLNNGFNDFIAKPIDADQLCAVIKKHLPPEKIRAEDDPQKQKDRLNNEEELRRRAAVTFAKENRNTLKDITDSLNSGDIQTAHRIAHTLKSGAGYLGRKELQEAAFSLERSLQCEPADYKQKQLDILEKELKKTLDELEPLLKEAESRKPDVAQIDDEQLTALLSELEPLLNKGDFAAVKFVEKLQGIAGMEKLAERIDDYDFEGALRALNSLETR